MLNDSLAPVRRAFAFFGFMAVVVATLTFGAGLQVPTDQSSTAVAQAKLRENLPAENRFAAVDPAQKLADRAKRAIATSQEARLAGPDATVLR